MEQEEAPQDITCSGGLRLEFISGNRPEVQEEESNASDD